VNREIILSNFAKRPVRTGVSMLAVAIEVSLILLVVGLVNGIITDNGERITGVGADIMFQPPGAALFLGMSNSVMPIEIAELFDEFEGVEAVAPIVTQFNTQNGLDLVFGLEPDSFNAVSGGFTFFDGEIFDGPDEIVIDDLYAEAKVLSVGDEMTILNHTFTVSGIVDNGRGARLYIDLAAAQEMTGNDGNVSLFFIRLVDPDTVYDVQAQIEARMEGYRAAPLRDMVSMMSNANIGALDAFLSVVVGVSVVIGALVIFLSMYTTISERKREIGILRSLGASKSFVVILILEETLWLCVAGVVAGIGASILFAAILPSFYATLQILISTDLVVQAALLAVGSSILGAVYPAMKAAGEDPVEALAYE
jgi:putative ABC transport system permease protein